MKKTIATLIEIIDSLNTYIKQLKQERDIAKQQLAEIGLTIGAKMDDVKKAMERYKAEEPVIRKGKYSDEYNCPKCGYKLIYRSTDDDDNEWFCGKHFKFCPECGQTLKWEK